MEAYVLDAKRVPITLVSLIKAYQSLAFGSYMGLKRRPRTSEKLIKTYVLDAKRGSITLENQIKAYKNFCFGWEPVTLEKPYTSLEKLRFLGAKWG